MITISGIACYLRGFCLRVLGLWACRLGHGYEHMEVVPLLDRPNDLQQAYKLSV
jgi:hypothetical protein